MKSQKNNVGLYEKIRESLNLVLMAVFWNSFNCVADELVAREYPQLKRAGRFGLPHICHVAHLFGFLGSAHVRTTWNTFGGMSTCAIRGTHLFHRQVNICSRHCNSASGYDAGCIWSCGGCSGYFLVVPSLSPHLVPHVYTYLLHR